MTPTRDFTTARRIVQQYLDDAYAGERESPKVRGNGFDTGDAWAPLIDWDRVLGVYIYLVDKTTGDLTGLSFPAFDELPDPQQTGSWPTNRLAILVGRVRETVVNHPGHASQQSHGRKRTSGKGTVRDTLAGAESIGQINAAAAAEAKRITGRDIAFDLDGDPQLAKEHAEGVLRGLERYPKTPLDRVIQGGSKYAEDQEAWAETSSDGSVIAFTNDAQRLGPDSYRADLKTAQDGGHLVAGTPMGIAMHEFGHAAANSYRLNGWANNKASEYAEIEMGTTDVRAAATRAISRRAGENDHEMAAEAFADVMLNGSNASGMSTLIVDTFDAHIRVADAPDED
jgi:hypothetical protein